MIDVYVHLVLVAIDTFLIYARIIEDKKLISGLGILISKKNIDLYTQYFNKLESSLTRLFSTSHSEWFENSTLTFGDELIKHSITNYCGKGYYDYRQFNHLIEYFLKLRSTTFEGESFSTGLILTKSHFAYKKKANQNRYGDIFPLTKKRKIRNSFQIDRRFWYLADGKHTFFVANKDLNIAHLFVIDNAYNHTTYVDNNLLSSTLKGGDILFKIENEKNFSIIHSSGIEFLFQENSWKLRNYNLINNVISKYVTGQAVINKLLFLILHCSKNAISSVLWIPSDTKNLNSFVKKETLNKLTYKNFSVKEDNYTNHILRFLSSDGATIIDSTGNVLYYGCIVEMKELEIKGVKGTGESAAEVLGNNGIAFKISQDGTIKIFTKEGKMIL